MQLTTKMCLLGWNPACRLKRSDEDEAESCGLPLVGFGAVPPTAKWRKVTPLIQMESRIELQTNDGFIWRKRTRSIQSSEFHFKRSYALLLPSVNSIFTEKSRIGVTKN